MQKIEHEIYSFGEFTLDVTRGCLLRHRQEIKLRPKSFEVLKFLVENNGRLVGKNEVIDSVWAGTAVTDDSLVQCLKDIRNALDDRSHTFIKTVPRRGYVFEADVFREGAVGVYVEETTGIRLVIEDVQAPQETGIVRLRDEVTLRTRPFIRPVLFAATAILMASVAYVAWRVYAGGSPPRMSESLFQNFEIKSLSHVGNIVNSAISPDGKYVVYTTGDAGRESIWVRQIATDSSQQIIPPAEARYYGVTFSPDGESVFYLRAENTDRNHGVLYKVPSPLGGIPIRILEDLEWCPTFSPDGTQMAFLRVSYANSESAIMIADTDGTDERILSKRPLSEGYDFPVWSPDGKTVAASAGSTELGNSFREVVAISIADGTEKPLMTRKWYWTGTLAWLPDGSGLIMAANPEKAQTINQLWLLSYPSGEVRRITNDSNDYTYLSFSRESRTLLAGHVKLLTHLWIAPEGDSMRARRITSGLGEYRDVRWTPDGKLLVGIFGGSQTDLWLRETDAGAPSKQLTVNTGGNGGASFSPDGRYIVFESDRAGDIHVYRMEADGSDAVQLTFGSGEKFPKISPDGNWIVYTSYPDWSLWRIPIEGGVPVRISEGYAREHTFSPDGRWIAYTTFENGKYRWALMPAEGGSAVKEFEIPQHAEQMQMLRFSPDSLAILFVSTIDGISNIWQQPIDGRPPLQLTNFPSDRIFSYDWSPQHNQLVVIRGAWTGDLALISDRYQSNSILDPDRRHQTREEGRQIDGSSRIVQSARFIAFRSPLRLTRRAFSLPAKYANGREILCGFASWRLCVK